MIPILIGLSILIISSVLSKNIESNNTTIRAMPYISPSEPNEIISNLYYPGASVIGKTDGKIILESSDDPKKITDWYKQKIAVEMNVKSFVTTTTNGEVLNKLLGADGNKEIRVEITKKSNEQKVIVMVSF